MATAEAAASHHVGQLLTESTGAHAASVRASSGGVLYECYQRETERVARHVGQAPRTRVGRESTERGAALNPRTYHKYCMHLCGHNARAIRRLLTRAASQHSSVQAKRKRRLRGLHSKHGTSPHPHEINACKSAPPKRRLLRWTLFSANSMRSNRVHHNKRIPDPSSLCYICDGSCPLCINHNHNHSDHDHSHKA